MAKIKKLGAPSDGESQKARNSKRWRKSKSLELQAMAKIKSLELQAMAKTKKLGTPSDDKSQIPRNSKLWLKLQLNSNNMTPTTT